MVKRKPTWNTPVEERFWAQVSKSDNSSDCWLWVGCKRGKGRHARGQIGVKGKMTNSSRCSWQIHFGEIPEGMQVLHRCDIPLCVRPDHLFLGTQRDNVLDMFAKGRAPRAGAANGMAKLTPEQVAEIRKLKGIITQTKLAERFGISNGTVSAIHTGKRWKQLG